MPRQATGPIPQSVVDRLGLGTGMRVACVGVDSPGFVSALRHRVGTVTEIALPAGPGLAGRVPPDLSPLGTGRDTVFLMAGSAEALALTTRAARSLAPGGSLWLIRHRSGSEVSRGSVLAAGFAAGLSEAEEAALAPGLEGIRFVHPAQVRGARHR